MKQYLIIGISMLCVAVAAIYFVWLVIRTIYVIYTDRLLNEELEQLRSECEAKRKTAEEENAGRLENGCDHLFETALAGLPPDVCEKCGLAKEKPDGNCDHVWKRDPGLIPASRCQNCGMTYGGLTAAQGAE